MSNGKGKLLLQQNGPGGYDIYVDPSAVRTVANYFQTRLQTFAGKQTTFATSTTHQDGEFGKLPLPETHNVNQQYVKSQQDAVTSLQDLATYVSLIAGGLTATADAYDAADGNSGVGG